MGAEAKQEDKGVVTLLAWETGQRMTLFTETEMQEHKEWV